MIEPIDYTNRLGKTYYLFQGKTKKGNPRYFFSPDPSGGKTECVPLGRIPQGFELFEHPNSNVVLRKKIKTAVLPFELHLVRDLVEELYQKRGQIVLNSQENKSIFIPFSVLNVSIQTIRSNDSPEKSAIMLQVWSNISSDTKPGIFGRKSNRTALLFMKCKGNRLLRCFVST